MPPFHDLRAGGAEPENESPAREGVERHRRHRGVGRRPPGELHDSRAELDLRRLRRDVGERRHRVRPVRLGAPHRVETETLGLFDEIHVERKLGAGISNHQTETHGEILLEKKKRRPPTRRREPSVQPLGTSTIRPFRPPARTKRCAASACDRGSTRSIATVNGFASCRAKSSAMSAAGRAASADEAKAPA